MQFIQAMAGGQLTVGDYIDIWEPFDRLSKGWGNFDIRDIGPLSRRAITTEPGLTGEILEYKLGPAGNSRVHRLVSLYRLPHPHTQCPKESEACYVVVNVGYLGTTKDLETLHGSDYTWEEVVEHSFSTLRSDSVAFSVRPLAPKRTLTQAPTPTPAAGPNQPPMVIDPNSRYFAYIHLAKDPNAVIEIELFADKAPVTVNSFVYLARSGFYDGLTFHRVIEGLLAQTGDPTGTGRGGPGYVFKDEFHPDLRHDGPGVVAMANSGKDQNGSQFYITFTAIPVLDGLNPDGSPKDCEPLGACFTVFGRVVSGMKHVLQLNPRYPEDEDTFAGDLIRETKIVSKARIVSHPTPGSTPTGE